jgi:diacylglycerol O-acyltransferase / wax synthase
MDRLSPLDASFLHIEDEVNLMHIGSVGIFEGPPPDPAAFAAMVAGKLPLVPRYRQRVREVPLNLGRPVWADDPHFALDYHLRHTALPSPGGREQLRNLVGRIMAQRLDLTKPLWEMWVVEGLEDGHWALISKVHHSLVDGVSGTDLLAIILDASSTTPPPVPDSWRPADEPSGVRLAGEAVTDLVVSPFEQWRAARSFVRRPLRVARQMAAGVRGMGDLRPLVDTRPSSTLVGRIGPHRRYAWTSVPITDVKTVRRSFGGSLNDVVLAAVTNGYRELLLAHGEPVDGRTVRTLVPVSVRKDEERGTYNNRVSAIFAELPVGIEDPVERLDVVRAQMDELKQSAQSVAAEQLTSLSGFAPALLLALGTRMAFRTAHRMSRTSVETVTTNVPGPQVPLYALGRQLLTAYPYVPVASPMRVGTAIFSYNGALTFGVTADRDSVPEPQILAQGIETGFGELVKAAEGAAT